MGDFANECISLALGIEVCAKNEDAADYYGGTKFYHSANANFDGDQSIVTNLESDEAMKDADNTVFLVGKYHMDNNEATASDDRCTSSRDDKEKENSANVLEYGRLGKNKALGSVFVLDNVLLPLLRQEVSKRQKSNLRSSLHLTYAKKFASHVCRFNEQTMKGVKLSLPNDFKIECIDVESCKLFDPKLKVLEEYMEIWIESIQKMVEFELKKGNRKVLKNPLEEVEFWRQRHTVFTDALEQMKINGVKVILEILQASGSNTYKRLNDKVNDVAKYEAEAAENMKFLTTLERHFRVLNEGSLDGIHATIPALLDGMRMVWTISKFYCRDEQMAPLLVVVAKQITLKVKQHINLQDLMKNEFTQIHETLMKAKKIFEQWKKSYLNTRAKIERMGKGHRQWEFDRTSLFETTDYMADICSQIMTALVTIEDLNQFLKPEVNRGIGNKEKNSIQFEELAILQKLYLDFTLDPFDRTNEKEWYTLTKKFDAAVADVEEHADAFLQRSFGQLRSSEGAFYLIQQFKGLMSCPNIQKIVSLRYQDMLQQYEQELEAIEDHFIQFKDDPPLAFGLQKSSGSVLWANGLYFRAKRPILLFQKEKDLLDNGLGFKVKNSYLRFARSIESYNELIFQTWKERARIMSCRSLRMPLLRIICDDASVTNSEPSGGTKSFTVLPPCIKFPVVLDHCDGGGNPNTNCIPIEGYTRIETNFTTLLRDFIDEIKLFDSMGYKVPHEALHLTLQEQTINCHAINLQKLTNLINEILDSMTSVEFSIMEKHLKVLNDVLHPALNTINWSSQRIASFITSAFQSIEKFKSVLSEVRKHSESVEKLVLEIEKDSLVAYYSNNEIQTLSQLLSVLEATARQKKSSYKTQYGLITELIVNIEMAVCETDRGISSYLECCYCFWTRRIYNAIATMTLRSIFTFCLSSLSSNMISPFRTVNLNIDDHVLLSEPILSELKKYNVRCLRLICDAPRTFSRWLHETCLLSEDNIEASNSRASAIQLEFSFYKDSSKNPIIVSTLIGEKLATMLLLRDFDYVLKKSQENFDEFNLECSRWKKILDQRIKYDVQTGWIDSLIRDCDSKLLLKASTDATTRKTLSNSHSIDMSEIDSQIYEGVSGLKLDLYDVLWNISKEFLEELKNTMETYNQLLNIEPRTVEQLKVVINHIRKIEKSNMMFELKCKELKEKYMLMRQLDIAIPKEESTEAMSLYSNWQNLLICAKTVDSHLNGKRDEFKNIIVIQNNEFETKLAKERNRFVAEGPGCRHITLDKGFTVFQEWQTTLEHLVCISEDLNDSKDLLGIPLIPYSDLCFISISMDELNQIYKVYNILDEEINSQKSKTWVCFNADIFQTTIKEVDTKIAKIKQYHNKETLNKLQSKINDLGKAIPLLKRLHIHNESMQERHWKCLATISAISVKYLTVYDVLQMKLHLKPDQVDKILEEAMQEEKLEKNLSEISDFWSTANLHIKSFTGKSNHFILDSLEGTFVQLEDHLLLLQAMKSSKVSSRYQKDIKKWESNLNLVTECLNHWSSLQQQWIYLESIFSGSNDIRVQLPKGAQLFDEVSKVFQIFMKRTCEMPNVLHSCSEDHSSSLCRLSGKLDLCQKNLCEYLTVKRSTFARFFFLSDEEMISILGNSEVALIEPHLIKIFENVKGLVFTNGGRKVIEMKCSEGEAVELTHMVDCSGRVEEWMSLFEDEMKNSVRCKIKEAIISHAVDSKECWIENSVGMCALTSFHIWWTWQVEDAFDAIQNEDRQAMQILENNMNTNLSKLVHIVRSELHSITRKKANTLLIVETHARDIVSNFVAAGVFKPTEFEWESKLRFYWNSDLDEVLVHQCIGAFQFGNEYLGLTKRLVMTPLSDRCYLTLTQALAHGLGGAAIGPAGTGKTETIKDLAKSFGLPCFVFNCSDGFDYITMASTFAGLLQTGAWGCFDEFNRINVEVLSVISSQLETIHNSMIKGFGTVDTGIGAEVHIKKMTGFSSLGVFVTMNPSYAGRTELPENLKSLFRPIAMISPDYCKIIENILFSEGFLDSTRLARKIVTLYRLAKDQLSRQKHYDFGLRSLKAVLMMSSKARLKYPNLCEEELMTNVLQHANIAKLIPQDEKLFLGFLRDLFPSVNHQHISGEQTLARAVECMLSKDEFTIEYDDTNMERQIQKVLQLHETQSARHSTMLIGPSCGGKSFILKTLANVHHEFDNKMIKLFHLNPKAQSLRDLHGYLDILTRDWTDGIFPQLLRSLNQALPLGRSNEERWLILDGDVDPVWVENLNSVMDDNQLLTLPNGERIYLQPHCSIIFEVQDIQYASPATVSRCGMVWVDPKDLNYKLFYDHWMRLRYSNVKDHKVLRELFSLYAEPIIDFISHGKRVGSGDIFKLFETIPCQPLELCQQLCNFLNAYLPSPQDEHTYDTITLKNIYVFCVLFGVGGRVSSDSRRKINSFLLQICDFPIPEVNIYENFYCPETKQWRLLDSVVQQYEEPRFFDFYNIVVPNASFVLYQQFLEKLTEFTPTLLFGERGNAKTMLCSNFLSRLSDDGFSKMRVNMSSVQTSLVMKQMLDAKVEKRMGNFYGASSSRDLMIFMDDLHICEPDSFRTKQPIEFLRTLLEQGFYYNMENGVIQQKNVKNIKLVGTLTASTNKEIDLNPRFLSKICLLHIPPMTSQDLTCIFCPLLESRVKKACGQIETEHSSIIKMTTRMSIEIFNILRKVFSASPSKCFSSFSVRNLSHMYEGLCSLDKRSFNDSKLFLRCWRNEIYRAFFDQLSNQDDLCLAESTLYDIIRKHCSNDQVENILKSPMLFLDLQKVVNLEDKKKTHKIEHSYHCLREIFGDVIGHYNESRKRTAFPIILFDFAIDHILRIIHILQRQRSNALFVGFGGCGKRTLVKLAAYAISYEINEVEVKHGFTEDDFEDVMRGILKQTILSPSVLLLSEEFIMKRSFLEVVNDILHTKSLLKLFQNDEIQVMCDEFQCVDEGSLLEICIKNLHIVFTLSPSGNSFRFLSRCFPSLLASCTIDWFFTWPNEALKMVAIDTLTINSERLVGDIRDKVSSHMVSVHSSINQITAKFSSELKRHYQTTSKVFLDYLFTFNTTVQKCIEQNMSSKQQFDEGLSKMTEASRMVQHLQNTLNEKRLLTLNKTKEVEQMIVKIEEKTKILTKSNEDASKKQIEIEKQNKKIAIEKTEADRALNQALPAVEAAAEALNNIKREDLKELKAFNNPPIHVKIVCQMCTTLCPTGEKLDDTWVDARKMLGNTKLIDLLKQYPKENLTEKMYQRCMQILRDNDKHGITVANLATKSQAGKGLLVWVFAILKYYEVVKSVDPLRKKVKAMQRAQIKSKQELTETTNLLNNLDNELSQLRIEYDKAKGDLSTFQHQSSQMERRLLSAVSLIDGFKAEQSRWKAKRDALENDLAMIIGNSLIFASFQSYCGVFDGELRQLVNQAVKKDLLLHSIAFDDNIDPHEVIVNETQLHEWALMGLSMDIFSIQNFTLVLKSRRFPLCIDPQGQALNWIRCYYESLNKPLCVKSMKYQDYVKHLQIALEYGNAFVLENVGEDIDARISNLLLQKVEEENGKKYVYLGQKRVEWNSDFCFYLCTKFNNPRYSPEITSTINLVNFSITRKGLTDHLLRIVLTQERPELEMQYQDVIQAIGTNMRSLRNNEGLLLKELSSSSGNILDNERLIDTLNMTRKNAASMKQKISQCNNAKVEIEEARKLYQSIAQRGSTLYFSASQLSTINRVYEMSLSLFIHNFTIGLERAKKSDLLTERLESLLKSCTREIFDFVNIGIFNHDRLTYSFYLTCMIINEEKSKEIDPILMNFFIEGNEATFTTTGQQYDVKIPLNIQHVVYQRTWDHLNYLSQHNNNFAALRDDLMRDSSTFLPWIQLKSPKLSSEPSGIVFSSFEKLCVIKMFQPDCCYNAVNQFVIENMGANFARAPGLNYEKIFHDSSSTIPVLFIVSEGADPSINLRNLSEGAGCRSPQKLHVVSLGQGQGSKAHHAINSAAILGHWVLLQNCHLLGGWISKLESLLNSLSEPHKDFRLWLTTESTHSFPIDMLQMSHRVIVEEPCGFRLTMQSNLINLNESMMDKCKHPRFGPTLFCLAFVHSAMQERQKYGKLGWNMPYKFTQSDFTYSQELLSRYLSKLTDNGDEDISWTMLKYLIGDVVYGGRVSDIEDRRILQTYFDEYFGDFLFSQPLSKPFCFNIQNESYCMPDSSCKSVKDFVNHIQKSYPSNTNPTTLGLNSNAETNYFRSKIEELCSKTKLISRMDTVESIGSDEQSRNERILRVATNILSIISNENNFCKVFEVDALEQRLFEDDDENNGEMILMSSIFLRELKHWNELCMEMFESLSALVTSLNSANGLSDKLNKVAHCLCCNKIPYSWRELSPPTTKNLSSWTSYFQRRQKQYNKWFKDGQPKVIWIGGLHSPQCFLSALLQRACRRKDWALDETILYTEFTKIFDDEFAVNHESSEDIKPLSPLPSDEQDAAFISGLYLDGATWDTENSRLMDLTAESDVFTQLPIMKVVPILKEKIHQDKNNCFRCPVYATKLRNQANEECQVFETFLNSNKHQSFWILQGVAAILNTD